MSRAIRIVQVKDGRPGHEKQTLGVVAALSGLHPVETVDIRVKPGRAAFGNACCVLIGSRLSIPEGFSPDLIIGTGSHTHLVILGLRNRMGGRAVTCMAPGPLLRRQFDLCFVPRHDGLSEGGNIFLTDGPPGMNLDQGRHNPNAGLVLVGGTDPKSHTWDNAVMADRVCRVMESHPGLSFTVTTSPRTPAAFLDALHARMTIPDVRICPFGTTPAGWLEEKLAETGNVAVTEDSVSMIFEALSAGCRVVTVPVDFIRQNKFVNCVADLKNRGLLTQDFHGAGAGAASCLNEALRCAMEMEKRWWKTN